MELISLIRDKEDLIRNIQAVEKYLSEGNEDEFWEMVGYIQRGTCFVAYEIDNKQISFVPSKFIGHLDNTLKKHGLKQYYGGGDTNRVISKILSEEQKMNEELDEKYLKYCSNLGINPNKKERKYWSSLKKEFLESENLFGDFPEGRIVERRHKYRERNAEVIKIAKQNFKNKHGGRLFCQICEFDFGATYGKLGRDFIEGHHIIPVSNMEVGDTTNPNDIAILCSNCHRMVHIKRPWLGMDELSMLLKNKNRAT